MYIYNVTFLVEHLEKEGFLQWMRGEGLPALVNAESPAREPRLTMVAEVPGDPSFGADACSFAFQVEFPDLLQARQWAEDYLQPVLGKYTLRFGAEKALCFATILEEVNL